MFLVEQAHWFYEARTRSFSLPWKGRRSVCNAATSGKGRLLLTGWYPWLQDFCRERNPQLKSLSLKEFTGLLFGHCPGLTPFKHLLDDIYNKFNRFKQSVPTMGAILLDPSMEKCLLVRGISQSHGWGFPKGKVAKDESDQDCAIREVVCLLSTQASLIDLN